MDFAVGNRSMSRLAEIPPVEPTAPRPLVSVIIPARNEAGTVRVALQSVLEQDYPALEFLLLNDRSDDGTGAVLDEMARRDPRLTVHHVRELPHGWIGKNHALCVGAERARGEWLLFADADIVMQASMISRAVARVTHTGGDHLAAIPAFDVTGAGLRIFVNGFTVFFSAFYRPWRASDPRSRRYVGIGACNLVRAAVYRAVGTHRRIAMRPDDDMKLGKLIKRAGFRQEAVNAHGLMSVRWYPSLGHLIQGLMKNALTGVEYRLPLVLLAVVVQAALDLWPLVALTATDGVVRAVNAACIAVRAWTFIDSARLNRMPWWLGLGYPFAALVMMYILARAAVVTYAQGGVRWRGTFYPLAQLRANRV